jgi:O-antigen/teichoic acid export membrane protein
MLAGVIVAVNMKIGVVGFALIYVISALVSFLYCLCVLLIVFPKKFPDIKSRLFRFDTQGIKGIVGQCWPIGVMLVLIIIRLKVDTIMLSVFGGDKAVGLYNSAYRFVDISSVVPTMIVSALFPTLAYLYSAAPGRFDTASSRALKLLLFLALPLVFVVIMFAGPIINLTFGADYGAATATLQILICTAGVMFLSTLTGTLFVTADKQHVSMILAAVALLLNVVLNLILIPMYSQVGAAITAFATELLGLIAGVVLLTKMGHKFSILTSIRAPLMAVVSCAIIVWLAQLININRIIVAVIALVVYAAVIYRFGIDKEDIALFKELYGAGNMDKGK